TCGRTSHFVAQQVSVILRCRSKIVELASEYDRTGRNPHTCSVGRRHRVGRGADRRLDPRRDLARAAAGPLEGGLITVIRQGRHRYYRLAGHEVAAALEALGLISPGLPVRSLRQSREAAALAEARTCYDHLAGRAGVEVLDGLLRQGLLKEKSGRTDRGDTSSHRFEVTGAGAKELSSFGLNLLQLR